MGHFARGRGNNHEGHREDELLVPVVDVLDVELQPVHELEGDDGDVLRDSIHNEGPTSCPQRRQMKRQSYLLAC